LTNSPKIFSKKAKALEQAYKPNFVPARRAAIIHPGRSLPNGSSDLPGNAADQHRRLNGQFKFAFPYLVLHHEEFTRPRMLPHAPVSSYLTISPITFFKAGLLSVALVVVRSFERPEVIRLVAL